MNLDTILSRTREIAGFREAADKVLDDELTDIVNDAYLTLCDLNEWPFLMRTVQFDSVAEQAEYADADMTGSTTIPQRIDLLYVHPDDASSAGQGRRLRPLREAERVDIYGWVADEPSTPLGYTTETTNSSGTVVRKIVLFPEPQEVETFTIRGRDVPAKLTAGTDQPVFDDQFHPAVPYLAATYLVSDRIAEWADDNGEAIPQGKLQGKIDRLESRAGSYIGRMEQFYLRQHDDGLILMGRRRDSMRRRTHYR